MINDHMRLDLKAPIVKWDDAIPLGNGLTGALIWGKKNVINITMDRGDIWDNRKIEAFDDPEFTWKKVKKLVEEKNQKGISNLFDTPYNEIPYPTKLPVGRIQLLFSRKNKVEKFSLDLKTGEATVSFKNVDAKILFFFHQEIPLLLIKSDIPIRNIKFKGPGDKRENKGSHSRLKFKDLGYPPYKKTKGKNFCGFQQQTLIDGNYSLYGEFVNKGDGALAGISVAFLKDEGNSQDSAVKMVKKSILITKKVDLVREESRQWWKNFWGSSKILIPDEKILLHNIFMGLHRGEGHLPCLCKVSGPLILPRSPLGRGITILT